MVSRRVIEIIKIKNATAMKSNMALNFTSQYRFMKKAATKNAFTNAIEIAVMTSKGGGMAINFATTTVIMVSINKAVPTAHSWPAVEM